MRRIVFVFLFIAFIGNAQNPGYELMRSINGVDVYFKKTKTNETMKKDTWIIEFEFINSSENDIFYKSVAGSRKDTPISHFALVTLENAKTISFISDSDIGLRGDKTRLITDQGDVIYTLKKGKTYTRTMNFRGDKGVDPVLTIHATNSISFSGTIYDFM